LFKIKHHILDFR